ncbi:Cysteine-rich secretory protein family protein [Pedobacter sp. ok626]|uniref:CAP domain-containing protein n=1 Tax=Pedobacter sp. ok626 TaxID=1761882 RepID=UPI00088050DE|nr:CAP domain-containing protein [Pedobacter sp. ok626]SDK42302.1 Cysteine-rich secretory protein family protein [Pedobacter sp. ok626]
MKPLIVLLIWLIPGLNTSVSLKAQSSSSWSEEELRMANTAKNARYLNSEEKDLVMYMNLARINGEKFFKTYFQEFLETYNQEMAQYSNYNQLRIDKDRYYKSLEKDLKPVKNLPVLYPDEALSWVAQQHAKDMNKYNYANHNSKDGRSAKDRISSTYPKRALGENLAFGFPTGLGNVCMLLLDKGVPGLGHRKLIINTTLKLNYVGVSIQPHKGYRYCSVTDFVALPI